MKLKIAWIKAGKTKEPAIVSLTDEYLNRISRYVQVEGIPVRDEADLLAKFGSSAAATRLPGVTTGSDGESTFTAMP